MYFVKSGSLSVVKNGIHIYTLSNGALFGEAGLLFGKSRSATIIAETRCVYFALAGGNYAQITTMYPDFHHILELRARARLEINAQRKLDEDLPDGPGTIKDLSKFKDLIQKKEKKLPRQEDDVNEKDASIQYLMHELKLISQKLDSIIEERRTVRNKDLWKAWKKT